MFGSEILDPPAVGTPGVTAADAGSIGVEGVAGAALIAGACDLMTCLDAVAIDGIGDPTISGATGARRPSLAASSGPGKTKGVNIRCDDEGDCTQPWVVGFNVKATALRAYWGVELPLPGCVVDVPGLSFRCLVASGGDPDKRLSASKLLERSLAEAATGLRRACAGSSG